MPDGKADRAKIVFVLPDFNAGGAQHVMVMLAGGLDRNTYDPTIVVFDGEGPWAERVPRGVAVTDLDSCGVRRAYPALMTALRHLKPDIVISSMGYVNFAVLMRRPRGSAGSRYIVREANTLIPPGTSRLKAELLKFAYRRLYPRADRVIAPSERIADEIASELGLTAGDVTVLRNPVQIDALRASALPLEREPGQGPRFVCVGRLNAQKAYGRLLEMMNDLRPDGHITIIGEGPERSMLEEMSTSYGLQGRVTLAGFKPNPAPWVAGADALLLPSLWEGLPNVALEALALGTPVISTPEAGGIGEIARMSPPGAVILEDMGPAFSAAMSAVKPTRKMQVSAPLLPDAFHHASVNAAFSGLLDDVLGSSRPNRIPD